MNQLTSANGGARIHDADGNLIDDGTKLFVWDAENRLIEIKLKSDGSTVAAYAYDYQSRRITKTVGSTVTNFVYDGWNPIAEYTSALSPLSFTLSTSYTWGMDLSGSMQGAGGVGGLLSLNDGSATYYPTYDGNGNVSEYVDATGAVVAHYEYDAFGQVVASGTKADEFTHQFSTKQLDSESGLHYYGYRYYDSSNGRWPSRDPIGERGGVNLYGFVGNEPVSRWDYLGLRDIVMKITRWRESSNRFQTKGSFIAYATDEKVAKCCNSATGETLELPEGRYQLRPLAGYRRRTTNYPIPAGNYDAVLRPANLTASGRIFPNTNVPTHLGNRNLDFTNEDNRGFSAIRGHVGSSSNSSRGCVIFGCNSRPGLIPSGQGNLPDDRRNEDGSIPVDAFSPQDSVNTLAEIAGLIECVKKKINREPKVRIEIEWRRAADVPRAIPVEPIRRPNLFQRIFGR